MAAYVVTARQILLGTTWSVPATAPGPGIAPGAIAGTITGPSDLSPFTLGGGEASFNANMVDVTNMGSQAFSQVIPGITSADDLVIDLNADEAATMLAVIVRTTLGGIARPGSAPIFCDVKNLPTARSATNPSFAAAAFIKKWLPRNGAVGGRAAAQLTLAITGSFADLVA